MPARDGAHGGNIRDTREQHFLKMGTFYLTFLKSVGID